MSRLKQRLERRTAAIVVAVATVAAVVPAALASTAPDDHVATPTSSDPSAGQPVVGAGAPITAAAPPARQAPTPKGHGERVAEEPAPTISGWASWYGPGFAGRTTASGEVYDPSEMVAAHKSLPFGTRIRVTNQRNGRTTVLRIVDRGPYVGGRILDVSAAAADVLGMKGSGTAPVSIEIL